VTQKPAARVSWVLLAVLVAALATGAAASILVAASTAPPPPSGTASLIYLPQWVITAVSVAMICFVVGSLVFWRLTSGPSSALSRMAVTILAVVLLGVLFVAGARLMGIGGEVGFGSSSPPNGGSNSTYGSNNTTVTGALNGTGGTITLFPSLPGWVPFVVLGIVVLLAIVVGVPQTRRYLAERRESAAVRRGAARGVPAGMRAALSRASADLNVGGDPRTVILALYAAMLDELRPMADDLRTSTPEEIRATHLVRLGVRPEAARTLTRLFEEARYSTHPMGPSESARARDAVRATLEDLSRRALDE